MYGQVIVHPDETANKSVPSAISTTPQLLLPLRHICTTFYVLFHLCHIVFVLTLNYRVGGNHQHDQQHRPLLIN